MKRIFVISSILLSLFATAQTAARWENIYGGPGIEDGYGVRCYFNKGYVAVGSSGSLGVSDGYLVRTDTIGLTLWEKFYGGANVDVIRAVRVLPDSGLIMAGFSNSGGYGGYDGWLVRADKNGDTLWTKYYGTSNWDFFYDVYPTYDSGFVIAGGTYGIGAGDEDMYFVKTDKNGDTLWTKTYGGIKTDEARGIIQTSDSLYVACGFRDNLGDSTADSWVLRLNQSGDTIWTNKYGNYTGCDKSFGITAINSYGWILVVGQTTAAGDASGYLWYMTYAGASFLTYTYGPAGEDFLSAITSYPITHYGMTGFTSGLGAGNGDYFFVNEASATTYGDVGTDIAYAIDTAYAGGYIIAGSSTSFNQTNQQLFLVKLDSNLSSTNMIGIHELTQPTNDHIALAYPVPANDHVLFSIPASDRSRHAIEVLDLQGRIIKNDPAAASTFVDEAQLFSMNIADLPDGVYFANITADSGDSYVVRFIVQHP